MLSQLHAYPQVTGSSPRVMSRRFASGTNVSWTNGTRDSLIRWADGSTTGPGTPTPGPGPSPPSPPLPPPSPPLPAANYQGCFVDKEKGACDLPIVKAGHCPTGGKPPAHQPRVMSVELCNALCDGHAFVRSPEP